MNDVQRYRDRAIMRKRRESGENGKRKKTEKKERCQMKRREERERERFSDIIQRLL